MTPPPVRQPKGYSNFSAEGRRTGGGVKKTVAITGGTRGIGREIAELFFTQGSHVAVCSRSARESSLPKDFFHLSIDVRDREAMNRFVAGTAEKFGGLHAFVNCAGVSQWKPLQEIEESFLKEVMETNVFGTFWGCQAAAEVLNSGGSIINVSSLAGKRGSANNSAYCASKFAVNGITQALAKELGPRGIRVNAVCPVYVTTKTILNVLQEKASPTSGKDVQAYLNDFTETQTALKRLPTAEEVAHAVYFLASDAASGITGQCLNVDCGVFPQ